MTTGSTRRRTFGYRIRGVLALIAVIPLLGAGWFSAARLSESNTELAKVEFIDQSVDRLVALTVLRTRIITERNWVVGILSVQEAGISTEITKEVTGLDLPSEAEAAAIPVDALVAELGLDEAATELEAIRNQENPTMRGTQARFEQLEQDVGSLADRLLDEVTSEASGVRDNGELTQALRILDAAAQARQSITGEFGHYFGAQFPKAPDADSTVLDRNSELLMMIGNGSLRAEALGDIDRLAPAESRARAALEAISASEDAAALSRAIDELVTASLDGDGEAARIEVIASNIESFAQTFSAALIAIELYLDLVNSAGDDLNIVSSSATSMVQQRYNEALIGLVAVAAISLIVAIAAIRAIARPVRLLGVAARNISEGDADGERAPEIGPIEVRQAARAINEAGEHLALAERQALALAKGDLNSPSLRVRSSGALGASLQSAVHTLAVSMKEREEFRRRMAHEATHDGLTHLPNRNASIAQLERGLARTGRGDRRLAVFFIDLDGFKDVNDRDGRRHGDIVLRVVSQRLAATVRDGDHVGRLGGDEFLVIAEPVSGAAEALELAKRLGDAISVPITIDGKDLCVGASIGIALSNETSTDAEELLGDADLAVYQAKDLGGHRAELCDDTLRARQMARVDLEDAIRTAVAEDEFVLHYQPIIDPNRKRIAGYETLVRWERPGHGVVPPDEFIPLAERSDLIYSVDQWVLRTVARQIVSWDAAGVAPVPISINVSGRSLLQRDFVSTVLGAFDEFGIDLERIIIEVTESALLDDLGTAATKLDQLRARGIKIAIDDFGTGYTSLAHLKSLPVDILKIDRSFTNDESAASLVQLIIDTGHLLGATITAEGIETQRQANQLCAMGSDDLQGYFFGKPRPASELDLPLNQGFDDASSGPAPASSMSA